MPVTDTVDYAFMIRKFCDIYVKNPAQAGIWAKKYIPAEKFPELRPLVRKELQKRGVRFKNND